MSFNILISLPMPEFHLQFSFLDQSFIPGQQGNNHDSDISTTEQGTICFIFDPLLDNKGKDQDYQSHMMMPSIPLPDLIIGHSRLAFGILKGTFYPIPLSLHEGKLFHSSCCDIGIAQTIFYFVVSIVPADYKYPFSCVSFLVIPYPYLHYMYGKCQSAFCSIFRPAFRDKQPAINKAGMALPHKARINTNLTVIYFPDNPGILPRNSCRIITFFQMGGFIPESLVDVQKDSLYSPIWPERFDSMLLIAGSFNLLIF